MLHSFFFTNCPDDINHSYLKDATGFALDALIAYGNPCNKERNDFS